MPACFKPVISALYDDKNSEKMLKGAGRGVWCWGSRKFSLKIIFSLFSELWEKGHGSVGVKTKSSEFVINYSMYCSELKREYLGSCRKCDGLAVSVTRLFFQVVCANFVCKLVPMCFRK